MKNPVTLTALILLSLHQTFTLISKRTTYQSDKERFCCPTIHQKIPVFIPIYTSTLKPNRQSYTNPLIKKLQATNSSVRFYDSALQLYTCYRPQKLSLATVNCSIFVDWCYMQGRCSSKTEPGLVCPTEMLFMKTRVSQLCLYQRLREQTQPPYITRVICGAVILKDNINTDKNPLQETIINR